MAYPHPRARRGATLLELVIALGVLSGMALASAPIAARTAAVIARGRALLEAVDLATTRRALAEEQPCGTGAEGTDSSARAVAIWRLEPAAGTLRLTLAVEDHGRRWPPESLATILRCVP